MNNLNISNSRLKALKQRLNHIASKYDDNTFGRQDENSPIFLLFSLSTAIGYAVYKSITDVELLNVLKAKAMEIGHAPSQQELFWVWRDYIKLRFKKWNYALKEAGLPISAGSGGKSLQDNQKSREELEFLLGLVKERALKTGKIPHPIELPETSLALKKYMSTWADVIKATGINNNDFYKKVLYKIEDLEVEYLTFLGEIKKQAELLGRSPLLEEVPDEIRKKLIKRCGFWRNVLYQIDLEAVIRINPFSSCNLHVKKAHSKKQHNGQIYDCYYKLYAPSVQTVLDLEFVKRQYHQQNRMVDKKEIPKEIRKRLQESCGSWANALYQIGLIH